MKALIYFTSTLFIYHASFLTNKQNDRCSFLCTWTNFHQGQMILCITTANLIFIYGFFSPLNFHLHGQKKGIKLLSLRSIS